MMALWGHLGMHCVTTVTIQRLVTYETILSRSALSQCTRIINQIVAVIK